MDETRDFRAELRVYLVERVGLWAANNGGPYRLDLEKLDAGKPVIVRARWLNLPRHAGAESRYRITSDNRAVPVVGVRIGDTWHYEDAA